MSIRLLIVGLLVLAVNSFHIDEHNYFYLNSSYARETISFSFCFRFSEPTSIVFDSKALIKSGDHRTVAKLDDEKSIRFDPPFDPEIVGYNSYDGQYWFGIKNHYVNGTTSNFEKIILFITQGDKFYQYVFMLSLHSMPVSAFMVYPSNTLFRCGENLLLSYLYRHQEIDFYVFGKNTTFQTVEAWKWGFRHNNRGIDYLRHKSKEGSKITVKSQESNGKLTCILTDSSLPENTFSFLQDSTYSYTFEELLSRGHALESQPQSDL